MWCLLRIFCYPSPVLSGYTACASTSFNPKLFHMSPPYLPICGIYPPFQVNLHVPNSKYSNNNLFCMPKSLMKWQGAVSIFHARWVILTMSGLRSSFTRKWLVSGMPSSVLKSNQNITLNKAPPGLLLVGRYPLFRTSHAMCLLVEGGKIFTFLFRNRL